METMDATISPDECSNFAKLIHNNSPEFLTFLSNAKNLLNKELLMQPDKRLTPAPKPDQIANIDNKTYMYDIDAVDKLFNELSECVPVEKRPIKHFRRPTKSVAVSRHLPSANTTISSRRNTSMITPSLTPVMRKSYDDISMLSNMWMQQPSSTPFTVQRSKSKDTSEFSMLFASGGGSSSVSNTGSFLSDDQLRPVSDDVLANVEQISNRTFPNVADVVDADARIFNDLKANLNKLKEFLDDTVKCVPVTSEMDGDTIDEKADIIDATLCKELRVVKEVTVGKIFACKL